MRARAGSTDANSGLQQGHDPDLDALTSDADFQHLNDQTKAKILDEIGALKSDATGREALGNLATHRNFCFLNTQHQAQAIDTVMAAGDKGAASDALRAQLDRDPFLTLSDTEKSERIQTPDVRSPVSLAPPAPVEPRGPMTTPQTQAPTVPQTQAPTAPAPQPQQAGGPTAPPKVPETPAPPPVAPTPSPEPTGGTGGRPWQVKAGFDPNQTSPTNPNVDGKAPGTPLTQANQYPPNLTGPKGQIGEAFGSLYRDENASLSKVGDLGPAFAKMAQMPVAHWVVNSVSPEVSRIAQDAQKNGQVPVYAFYNIPNRDNGDRSGGGASGGSEYLKLAEAFAKATQGAESVTILEPDALPMKKDNPEALQLVTEAAARMKEINPNMKVFVDFGHSNWLAPEDVATIGRNLESGGQKLTDVFDGFSSNVSNYQPTENEVAYGAAVRAALGVPPDWPHVIDTSRNGGTATGQPYFNNHNYDNGLAPGNKVGPADYSLWIKPPSEAD